MIIWDIIVLQKLLAKIDRQSKPKSEPVNLVIVRNAKIGSFSNGCGENPSYTHPNPQRNWKIVHYILALSPLKMLRINIYSEPDLKF